MTCRTFKVALIVVLLVGCQRAERGGVSPNVAAPLVIGVLHKAQASGSLEYWGRCDLGQLPDFPKIRAPRESSDFPVQALREIFADDPKMRVTQESDGTIRMVETDVPQDLLNVRISHISFKVDYGGSDALYHPRDALRAIMLTPEVGAFMRANNIGPPFNFEMGPGGRAAPSPELPHIFGSLDDVTFSQALDHVLRTFPGLWIYENCPSKKRRRAVFLTFYQR